MKKIIITLLFCLWFSPALATVEIDSDANGAVDIAKGGTNATTASQALLNLFGAKGVASIAQAGDVAIFGSDGYHLADGGVMQNLTASAPLAINTGVISLGNEVDYSNTSASGWTIALSNGTVQDLTMTGSGTITLPPSVAGASYMLRVHYSGSYTITWAGGSTLKWPAATAPTQTSANGNVDIFVFSCDGTNTYGASQLNY